MINIAWILWALKIAGMTDIEYGPLCAITAGILVFRVLVGIVAEYAKFQKLRKLGDETEGLTTTESILRFLMFLYINK